MEELQDQLNELSKQFDSADFMEQLKIKDEMLIIEQKLGLKTCYLDGQDGCESCSG